MMRHDAEGIAERGTPSGPGATRDVIAASVLVINLLWTSWWFAIFGAKATGCREECWTGLAIAVAWLCGEGVLALPTIVAAVYAIYSWRKWHRATSAIGLAALVCNVAVIGIGWAFLV